LDQIPGDVFEVALSLGTVANLEAQMSEILAPAHAEALEVVRAVDIKNLDETSWKLAGKLCRLWVAATGTVASFLIRAHCGRDARAALLGEKPKGFSGSDRWSAYAKPPPWCRRICWARLKRDFQKWLDRGGPAARLAQKLQRIAEPVFAEWHLFRGGRFDRENLMDRLGAEARELERLPKADRRCADAKAATFCANLLGLLPAVRRFVVTEGIEPRNNHGERLLRRPVLWRASALGSSSAAGCRFVQRRSTVLQHAEVARPVGVALTFMRRWSSIAMASRRRRCSQPSERLQTRQGPQQRREIGCTAAAQQSESMH
jgi:transposase